ncbi:hypothetical protein [Pyxidicoccus caerfyrddinensis]|uniref:hypothetical protein n=1 Tax=Pyxidicoccus caerfyrddinensis TaxID=2709663 RepID=UPI0013D951B1|nr:hypothetical protein [Pyxidicoccus caerfyrddinensis]
MTRWNGVTFLFLAALLAGVVACTPEPATGDATDSGVAQAGVNAAQADAGHEDAGSGGEAIVDPCAIPLQPLDGVIPFPRKDCLSIAQLSQLMWKSFIAVNWPADPQAGRGVAANPQDSSAMARTGVPRVWETWKADWEIDPKLGPASEWNSYAVARPPCKVLQTREGKRLEVTAENWPTLYPQYGGILQDKINLVKQGPDGGAPILTGPLIDSAREYLRYGTHFSRELYDCARSGVGAGCVKTPTSFEFPAGSEGAIGSIAVKASWRKLQKDDEKDRYHTRDVLVIDYEGARKPYTAVCRQETMVLLGLHVIYKNSYIFAPERGQNQWVWATFEHRDNAQVCGQTQFGFNKPQGFSHEPQTLPAETPLPPQDKRIPVMLCRTTAIPSFGVPTVNREAQAALPSPWDHYEMVNIQWLLGGQPSPTTSVANVTLEPYSQSDSCMGCHGSQAGEQASKADFIWALALDSLKQTPTRQWAMPLWR